MCQICCRVPVGRSPLLHPPKGSTSLPCSSSPRPQLATPSPQHGPRPSVIAPLNYAYFKESFVHATDDISVLSSVKEESTPPALFGLCQAKDKLERVVLHRLNTTTNVIVTDEIVNCLIWRQSSDLLISISDEKSLGVSPKSNGIHLEALSEFPCNLKAATGLCSSSHTPQKNAILSDLNVPDRDIKNGPASVIERRKLNEAGGNSNLFTVSSVSKIASSPDGSAGCLNAVFPGVTSVFGCAVPLLCGENAHFPSSQPNNINNIPSISSTIKSAPNHRAQLNHSADSRDLVSPNCGIINTDGLGDSAPQLTQSKSSPTKGDPQSLWSVGAATHVIVAGAGYPARGGSKWPGLDKSSTAEEELLSHLPDLVSPTTSHHISGLYFSQDTSEHHSIVEISSVVNINARPKLETSGEYVCQVDPSDILSHPDLGPRRPSPPKVLALSSSGADKAKKNVENELSKESYAEKKVTADTHPEKESGLLSVQVEKESLKSPKVPEVRQQIRDCLDRVRSRRSVSSSDPCPSVGQPTSPPPETGSSGVSGSPEESQPRSAASFAAGLYRLERLLRRGSTSDPASKDLTSQDQARLDQNSAVCTSTREVATITDVHQSEQLDEVELISLVQEQIPRYRLRTDPAAAAAGCSRDSWGGIVPFPALAADDEPSSPLSPDQAEATLQYFVLCGSRVSQMTKTYSDVEAVTRLLEEKEKDLELAARIGQQLVCRNRALEERQAALEQELNAATDANTQLQHQLQLKTNLLSIYTEDGDDSSRETTPSTVRHMSLELLQQKVKHLQDDNKQLRDEATRLAGATTECEEREDSLMRDVIKQLDAANTQVLQLSVELRQKNEEALKQHEETTLLLAQIVELQAKLKESVAENQELTSMVSISRECQQELSGEIAELKERYAEVLDLLHDTQEQLRKYSKKNMGVGPSRGSQLYNSLGGPGGSPFLHSTGGDSIASELSSLNASPTPPRPPPTPDSSSHLNRVLDTVKMAARPYPSLGSPHRSLTPSHSSYTPGYASYTPGYSSTLTAGYTSHTPGMPCYNSNRTGYTPSAGSFKSGPWDSGVSVSGSMTASGHPSLDSGADSDIFTDTEDNYPASYAGVPGYPGTPDLAARLRRIRPAHSSVTSSSITTTTSSTAPAADATTSTPSMLPYGCRTPDYIMATGPACSSNNAGGVEFPVRGMSGAKLQIIKPMEGSLTLHHWSRLATPDLGGLLQPHRDGIAIKSALGTRRDLELYSLSDLEEDDETVVEPRKQFMDTSGVFTYTNSTVLHVDDATHSSSALPGLQVSCSVPQTYSNNNATPPSLPASRRGSTATFSTNVGLARVLHERGVTEALSSACVPPTATPANSPEGSGSNTPVTSHFTLPSLQEIRSSLLEGASIIRRTLYPSPPLSPVLPSGVSILEKVSNLSLAPLPTTGASHQSVGGVVAPRPVPPSPLLHLSNLIRAGHSNPGPSMPSPDLSPGTRRPPLPSNAPLGVPVPPGQQDSLLRQPTPGAPRRDLGQVPRRPVDGKAFSSGSEHIGQLGAMKVGRKGGLL